ncbi:MAG: hypothetical protein WBN83_02230 [Desulfoprunum sp.]|jgi:hypothetical protein|uniref:hypothetical protein n=1 Tax=Desulfoprunum sp. TaxID=2020866 RepID=UPI00052E1BF3|nr:hypothetical protein JT06_14180 [Desulfobulbus sp. Tol-SR]
MEDQIKSLIHLEIREDSVRDLRGRQSVRTTFKLSPRSIHALSILASQMGIRQKSLFDYLVDDVQTLRVIAEGGGPAGTAEPRVAKTYVISRRTLENLEKISTSYNTPRDVLVEVSIERILPLIRREREKHERRKEFLVELKEHLARSAAMVRRAESELGRDDPVFQQLLAMLKTVDGCCAAVEECVDRGRRMEDFANQGVNG